MKSLCKKLLVLALTGAVATSMIFANGVKEADAVAKESKISLCTADNTYGLSSDADLQQAITDLLKEKTGVTITPIIPPLASYTDKLSTLVNSGDVPDVFSVSQVMTRIPQMAAREQLYDLTDYINNSAALKAVMDHSLFETPYIDGKLYFIPYNHQKQKGLYMRKDVLEKYGVNLSEAPTTEEFKKEMQKLVGTDVAPFTFPKWVDNFQFFYNSFGAWGGVYKNAQGKYVDGFQEPQMKDALAYLHELYQLGILNSEFITTENNQMREKVYTGKSAGDIDYLTNYINYIQNTTSAGAPTEMQVIYCLVGPEGKGGTLNEATQTAWAVSSKTKDPDAAFKVIETIVTDADVYPAFYGIGLEGKHYTIGADGTIQATDKAKNSGYNYTLNYLSDSFVDIDIKNLSFKLSDAMNKGVEKQRAVINGAVAYAGPNHASDVSVGASDEYDRVSPSIKSTRESIAAKIIIGTVTVDEGMAEYQNFWKSIDGDKILAQLNK